MQTKYHASVQLATDIGDTVKRIDGTEVPLIAPWQGKAANTAAKPKAKAAAKPKPAKAKADAPKSKPAPAATATQEEGTKPAALEAARDGKADDLKLIKGVGPKLEGVLNDLGYFHFDQIAAWSADDVAWADQNLVGFKGRVSRDDWVPQAKTLAAGGTTEFSKKVKKGGVY